MKRCVLMALMAFIIMSVAGCGNDGGRPTITTQILSDATLDGDIVQNATTSALTVSQGGLQSVFAGIDPATGNEYRTFLTFHLSGPGGVPGNAVIVSAFLDLFVNSILPTPLVGSIPIRIDLVEFQPPTLVGSDFDRTLLPPLASTTIQPPISQTDFSGHVPVDVTSLMVEAQHLGLIDFQVRIMRDLGPAAPGLVEINDVTGPNRQDLAPLLEVTYF